MLSSDASTLDLLNILNELVHYSFWTKPFIIFRGNFKKYIEKLVNSAAMCL
jgi:hypothetical protein